MLAISDLNVRYGMHEALSSVNLQVGRDEIVVILGANGAGKSTLLSAIAGNCVGEVDGYLMLDGEQLLGMDAAQVVSNGIAYVPEGRGVFSDLSVEENLKLGSYTEHARQSEQENYQRVLSLFPKLQERRKQIVRTMSGGEQQMVAIGRALMSAPSILMLDEPSLGLSPLLCKELFGSLQQVRDSGVGILLVEQNAKQSLSISDRGYLLGNGKIIGQDSAKNLLNDATVQAAYLGGAIAGKSAAVRPANSVPASGTSEVATPKTSGSMNIIKIGKHNKDVTEKPLFKPATPTQTVTTVSSDSLLGEGIDDLVARASSTALHHRSPGIDKVPGTMTSASKLHSRSGVASGSVKPPGMASNGGNPGVPPPMRTPSTNMPVSQDSQVQKLLAEFEAAAKNAASGSKSRASVTDSATAGKRADDDLYALPHIPVYKKSSVTVYRRDGSGKLRKQEKP